jgi:hypothetical protein
MIIKSLMTFRHNLIFSLLFQSYYVLALIGTIAGLNKEPRKVHIPSEIASGFIDGKTQRISQVEMNLKVSFLGTQKMKQTKNKGGTGINNIYPQ